MEAKHVGKPSLEQIRDAFEKAKSAIELIGKVDSLYPSEAGKKYIEYDITKWGVDTFPKQAKRWHFSEPSERDDREHQLIYDKFIRHSNDLPRRDMEEFFKWAHIETANSRKCKDARKYASMALYTIEILVNAVEGAVNATRIQAAGQRYGIDPNSEYGKEVLKSISERTIDYLYSFSNTKDVLIASWVTFNTFMKWLVGYEKSVDLVFKAYGLKPFNFYKVVARVQYLTLQTMEYNTALGELKTLIEESVFPEEQKDEWQSMVAEMLRPVNQSGKEWDVTRSQVMRANRAIKDFKYFTQPKPKKDYFGILGVYEDERA